MSTPINKLKTHCESQLDLLLRLAQVNHACLEKMVATHLGAIKALVNQTSIPAISTGEAAGIWLADNGKAVAGYCQACLRDSLDHQHRILSELAVGNFAAQARADKIVNQKSPC